MEMGRGCDDLGPVSVYVCVSEHALTHTHMRRGVKIDLGSSIFSQPGIRFLEQRVAEFVAFRA